MRNKADRNQHNVIFWITFGAFLLSYYWFYIRIVFFDPSRVMLVLETVRRLDPIGYDLMRMVGHANAIVTQTISPFAEMNNFTPLAALFYVPLTFVSLSNAYIVASLLTLASYTWIAFFFPFLQFTFRKVQPVLLLLFLTGLTSYGLQFELERGQFYSLAIALAFAGVYLFHNHPRLTWLGYGLFSLSIQLKIFPFIFIFLFIRDWRAWKTNLARFALLGMINIALLFILGWQKFLDFTRILIGSANDAFVWVGNMSVRSFTQSGLDRILARLNLPAEWLSSGGSQVVEVAITILILGLIGLTLLKAYRRNRPGIDPYLLFVLTAANLLLPSISHDYKLAMLAGPAAVLLMAVQAQHHGSPKRAIFLFTLAAFFSLAYFTTQFSTLQKSPLIANNFPAVFLMMVIAVVLCYIDDNKETAKI